MFDQTNGVVDLGADAPQPAETIGGVIFLADFVVIFVLTWMHVFYLRRVIREQRARRERPRSADGLRRAPTALPPTAYHSPSEGPRARTDRRG